ncbi:MAG: hypothetical protein EHM62_01795 [Methylococcus sp.]|nr:MAG: hypothetical protein EHM62_01795 [Methylococcus sp.]
MVPGAVESFGIIRDRPPGTVPAARLAGLPDGESCLTMGPAGLPEKLTDVRLKQAIGGPWFLSHPRFGSIGKKMVFDK